MKTFVSRASRSTYRSSYESSQGEPIGWQRNRELIALRYGAGLTAMQIAAALGVKANAVEVALHRALGSCGSSWSVLPEMGRPPAIGRDANPRRLSRVIVGIQ